MPKIKELLGREKEVWVDLRKENYRAFFKQAKEEGFVWINGREIREDENFPFCMRITQDGKLARVLCFQRFGDFQKPKIISFQL